MLPALEREHALPVGRVNHQRIDRSLLDGAESLLGVLQLGSQRPDFRAKLRKFPF